jgi:nucleoside phosphorylase/CheY-like chemotaxis protein
MGGRVDRITFLQGDDLRVIIIHDRPEMVDALGEVVAKAGGASCQVTTAGDVMSAIKAFETSYFDLAIIDLTLPFTAKGGDATLQNAEHVLETIFGGGQARQPGDVLGISREPDVLDLVRTSIGTHLMATIPEDDHCRWREAVAAKVGYVQRSRHARQLVVNSSYDFDVVITTALDKEATPYAEIFELTADADFDGAQTFTFADRTGTMRRGALFAIGKSGQAPCGSWSQALIAHYRPRLILLTGFCGGVEGRAALGDLVAFRSVDAWDYGKWVTTDGEPSFQPRPTTLNVEENGIARIVRDLEAADHPASHRAIAALAVASDGNITGCKLRTGGAGSGSAVVTSPEKVAAIRAGNEDVWAIDMESYAFYFACRNTRVARPDYLCVKAVADHCNGDKNSRLHAPCSLVSAEFAETIIKRHYDFG